MLNEKNEYRWAKYIGRPNGYYKPDVYYPVYIATNLYVIDERYIDPDFEKAFEFFTSKDKHNEDFRHDFLKETLDD